MADRTVDLVIRARNEASATLSAITQALSGLSSSQENAGATAKNTAGSISGLVTAFSDLTKTAQQLTAFGKVTAQLAQMEKSVTTLANASTDAADKARRLGENYEGLKANATAAADRLKATTDVLRAQKTAADNDARALKSVETQILSTQRVIANADRRATAGGTSTVQQAENYQRAQTRLASLGALQTSIAPQATISAANLASARNEQSNAKIASDVAAEATVKSSADFAAATAVSERLAATLEKVRLEYDGLRAAAQPVAEALGLDAAETKDVTAALERNAATVERLTAAYARLNAADAASSPRVAAPQLGKFADGNTPAADATAAYRAQTAAVAAAQAAYQEAQASLATLAKTEVTSVADAEILSVTFAAQQAEANNLRNAYLAQKLALDQLRAASRENRETNYSEPIGPNKPSDDERLRQAVAARKALQAATDANSEAEHAFQSALTSGGGIFDTQISKLVQLAAGYVTLIGGVHGLESALHTAVELEAAQVRITLALAQGNEAGAASFQSIVDQAVALKLPILEVTANYGKFLSAVKGTSIEGVNSQKIFSDLLISARAFKLDPENIDRATIALRDLAANGNVNLRFLRQLDQALPIGLLSRFATAAGFSADKLADFTKELRDGKIGLEVLLPAFEAAAADAEKGLPAALGTAQSSFQDFKNALLLTEQQITEGGFLTPIVAAVNELTSTLKSDDGRNAARQLGAALGQLVTVAATLLPYAKQITTALLFIGSIKVFTSFVSGAQGAIEAAQSIRTAFTAIGTTALAAKTAVLTTATALEAESGAAEVAAVATTEFGVALKAALPVGLVIGLASIVTALLSAGAAASNSADSVEEYNKVLARLRETSIDTATQSSNPIKNNTDALTDANRAVLKLRDAYSDAAASLDTFQGRTLVLRQVMLPLGGDTIRELQAIRNFAIDAPSKSVKELADGFAALQASMKTQGGIEAVTELKDNLDKLTSAGTKLSVVADSAKRLQSGLAGLDADIARAPTAFEIAKNAVDATKSGMDDATRSALEYGEALQQLTKEFPNLAAAAKLAERQLEENKVLDKARAADFQQFLATGKNTTTYTDDATKLIQQGRDAELAKQLKALPGASSDTQNLITRIFRFEAGSDPANFPGKREGQQVTEADLQRSGALGQGQFLRTTFEDEFRKTFPELAATLSSDQIAAKRVDPEIARAVATTFIEDLKAQLVKAGTPTTDANVYGAYNLGAAGFNKLYNAPRDASAQDYIDPKAYAGNQTLYGGKTVAEALDALARAAGNNSRLTSSGMTEQEAGRASNRVGLNKQLGTLDAEATNSDLNDKQKYIAQQVEEYRARTVDDEGRLLVDGGQVSAQMQQEIELLKQRAALSYDAQHARENERKAVEDIVKLEGQRTTLAATRVQQLNDGDLAGAKKTLDQITALDAKVKEAIPNARKLVEQFKDEGGAKSLDKVELSLKKVQTQTFVTGKQIDDSLATGLTTAFDTFATAVGSGQNAIRSLGTAFQTFASGFLKQIADMIVKQMALNAIQSLGLGGTTAGGLNSLLSLTAPATAATGTGTLASALPSFSSIGSTISSGFSSVGNFFSGILHEGGTVGAVGTRQRPALAEWFVNAPRFHEGGIVGLAPDEVPIIAKKNEEMLTANDPRNSINGGRAGAPNVSTQTHIYNFLDHDAAAEAMLATPAGEKGVLNIIKANRQTLKSIS